MSEHHGTVYSICRLGTLGIGVAAGIMVGGAASRLPGVGLKAFFVTVPTGVTLGFKAGYLICDDISDAVKSMFQYDGEVSPFTVGQAIHTMQLYGGVGEKDAMKLIAAIRLAVNSSETPIVCSTPIRTAQEMLAGMPADS